MARLLVELRCESRGLEKCERMLESLSEVMDVSGRDCDFEIETIDRGITFEGLLIVGIQSRIEGTAAIMTFSPGLALPLFASRVGELVPGVRVSWDEGWPIFRLWSGDDGEDDTPPEQHSPRTLELA